MAVAPKKARPRKKREAKHVSQGVAHIHSSFNNTIGSITDMTGGAISWASAGGMGFKGSKKSTPFAAQMAAETAARKSMEHGMKKVGGYAKARGAGGEAASRRGVKAHKVWLDIQDLYAGCAGAKALAERNRAKRSSFSSKASGAC